MSSSSAAKRSVADPRSNKSSSFLWVIVAVLAIAAIVIGLVVWQSNGKRTADLAERATINYTGEMEYNDGVVTLKAADVAEGAPEVSLYEDFSCSHCADLAVATDTQMLDEIQKGNLIVNIHPLNFLDKGADGHSTRALAGLLPLAQAGDTNAYLNLRQLLFEDQQSVYNQWGPEKFAESAAAFGASDEALNEIKKGDVAEANAVAQANADELNELTGSVSSPRVLRDGKDLEIQDLHQWVTEVVGE